MSTENGQSSILSRGRAADTELASKAVSALSSVADAAQGQRTVRIKTDDTEAPSVEVPAVAFRMFIEILSQMARGNAVTVIPANQELTTQEAADLLQVSRPYFVKLIDSGAIPYHRVGSRRRVKIEDLERYLEEVKGESRKALKELAAQAQELGMGY